MMLEDIGVAVVKNKGADFVHVNPKDFHDMANAMNARIDLVEAAGNREGFQCYGPLGKWWLLSDPSIEVGQHKIVKAWR